MKPLHAEVRSKAASVPRPSLAATSGATAGQSLSGDVVATTTASTADTPADFSALVPAFDSQLSGGHPVGDYPPLLNSGAGADPFVCGVQGRTEVVISYNGRRNPASHAGDYRRYWHIPSIRPPHAFPTRFTTATAKGKIAACLNSRLANILTGGRTRFNCPLVHMHKRTSLMARWPG